MKRIKYKFKKFILKQIAYNPDYFTFESIVIKLAYVQKENQLPIIELFENTKEAVEDEWCIYGSKNEKSIILSFQKIGEIITATIKSEEYEILFEFHEKQKYKYPLSSEIINVFGFRICRKT